MSSLLWGGRFHTPPDTALLEFTSSFQDDLALASCDVKGTQAHVAVLTAAGILSESERAALAKALETVDAELAEHRFGTPVLWEDVHSAIEVRVGELAGEALAAKMHAGRSRNDQVATAIALYARQALAALAAQARQVATEVLARADAELRAQTLLMGMTHWQPAQPILAAFWLHAVAVGLLRQARRFTAAAASIDRCPLGAAALAGSSLPLDRQLAADELGFLAPSENALDTVGDRDAVLDTLYACAACAAFLSRVSEELVLWCSPLLRFATLSDAGATGSSIMPQKKNPDALELVRAKAASVAGQLGAALAQVKGLALSYHRDLQETKRALVRGVADAQALLAGFQGAFQCLAFDRERCNAAADSGFAVATDLAEGLVRCGVPFRRAHKLVGERVSLAEREGRMLGRDDVRACLTAAGQDVGAADEIGSWPLTARDSVEAKTTYGSTNPSQVRRALERTRQQLAADGVAT